MYSIKYFRQSFGPCTTRELWTTRVLTCSLLNPTLGTRVLWHSCGPSTYLREPLRPSPHYKVISGEGKKREVTVEGPSTSGGTDSTLVSVDLIKPQSLVQRVYGTRSYESRRATFFLKDEGSRQPSSLSPLHTFHVCFP